MMEKKECTGTICESVFHIMSNAAELYCFIVINSVGCMFISTKP